MAQLGAMLLLMAGTVGTQFSIQAQFSEKRIWDWFARVVLAGFSLLVIFHPNTRLATLAILPVGIFIGYWLLQQRKKKAL
jgi:ABC-type iron transport system FetAB permease component